MQATGGPSRRRRPRDVFGAEDGIETIEVAFVAALIMVIILAAFPILTGGIDGALGMVSDRLSDIEIGG